MAPFVEREWGAKATEMMWRVKALCDPDGVLNPGVVLNRDAGVHLKDLQTTPPIEEEATTCVECGFCEPVCPSRWLTTTPRQRIVLRREMARQPAGSPVTAALLEEYEYDSIETCAADGSCKLACPLGIDTGKMVKEFRARQHTPRAAAGGGARRGALGGGRAREPRWACARPRRRALGSQRRARAARRRARAGAAARRAAARAARCPRRRARAPRPSTCRRASTASSARRCPRRSCA